jgi:alpha-tubulin suppressor-like RCC1 family protein/outer membrane protein OmpA-like peptidoglycan-associated protein
VLNLLTRLRAAAGFCSTIRAAAAVLLPTGCAVALSAAPVSASAASTTPNKIVAGAQHTCLLPLSGELVCWGRNASGQLGVGATDTRGDNPGEMQQLEAVDLGPGRTAVAAAAGALHTCALLDDATVKCWGHNGAGQLGLGDHDNRGDEPGEMGAALPAVDLGPGRTATAIAAGAHHTCALLDDATVKCWGHNAGGQLGLGDEDSRGDDPGEMGAELPAVDLGPGRTATAVAAGGAHTCAVLDDATVKCWGENVTGQLGLGDHDPRGDDPGEMGAALPAVDLGPGRTATAVAAGGAHTCAVLDDATVKCWGENVTGQLGLGDHDPRGDDPGEMGAALPAVDLGPGRTATAITAGSAHTCALLDDGAAACWGGNDYGTLGLGHTNSRGGDPAEMGAGLARVELTPGRTAIAIASSAGSDHVCAILDDQTIVCWGRGDSAQLGVPFGGHRGDSPGEMGADLASVDFGPQTVASVAAGVNHTCALLDTGAVTCWGRGTFGALGLGDTSNRGDEPGEMGAALPAVDLGPGRTATAITAGGHHTCALLDDSTVKCWGYNVFGQLGLGDTARRGDDPGEMGAALPAVDLGPGRTATAIAAGRNHTCALLDDSTVKCWGDNTAGQLGQGDTARRGDDPGEMGAALPAVDLGPGRTATAITAGSAHTCATLDDSTVKCWGDNTAGQLGQGDTANRGDAPGEMGAALPTIDLGPGRTGTAITAGSAHTCALRDDATVVCWGANARGQLGLEDLADRGDDPGEMGAALRAADLGPGRTATAISTGSEHTCALRDDATVACWGHNGNGQLGLGDAVDRGGQPGEMGAGLATAGLGSPRVVAITSNTHHNCVTYAPGTAPGMIRTGTVACWGFGLYGQLGYESRANRGDLPGQMGNFVQLLDLGPLRLHDGIAPTVSHGPLPGGWQAGPVAVALRAGDLGGSGLRAVRYAIVDGGGPDPDPLGPAGAAYDPAAPPRLGDGQHLAYAAADRWGNRSITHATAAAAVDTTPPATVDDLPASPQTTGRAVTLTATDGQSGVAATRYTLGADPADPAGPGALIYDPSAKPTIEPGQTIRYLSTDAVGNTEPARSATLAAATPEPPRTGPGTDPGAEPNPAPRPAANAAPTANAIVTLLRRHRDGRRTYRLDARTSIDPDGRIAAYRWTLDGRTVSTGARARVTLAPRARVHRIALTVTDDAGATATTTVTVKAPVPPPVRITIPARIAFAADSSALTSRAARLVRQLRRHAAGAARITIAGYTDDRGPAGYNRRLSRRRADRVARALLAGLRPRPRAVTVVGRGSAHPLRSNATAAGRAANRRVQITIRTTR